MVLNCSRMGIVLFSIACLGLLMYKVVKRLLHNLRVPNYTNRQVLITGCDSGFGHLLVKRLDKLGFHVFACCLTERAQEDFRLQNSSKVIPLELDITKEESILACLKRVKQILGDGGMIFRNPFFD